jgi:RNA polymerase sigma factor (sigma-70 family)
VIPPTDIELMNRVRDGDIRQLAQLFERHHRKLYGFFVRLTGDRHASEDMVQEVFFRMLKYRHTFRGEGEFSAWMYHLGRNVNMDHHRKNLRGRPAADAGALEAEEPQVQEQLEREQDRHLVQQALARLPVDKREVLILSRYQDLRYEAIAEILGCSIEAVKVRVHRAINELRTIYFEISGEKAHE